MEPSLALQPQEPPLDHRDSCNRFCPLPDKPFLATPRAIGRLVAKRFWHASPSCSRRQQSTTLSTTFKSSSLRMVIAFGSSRMAGAARSPRYFPMSIDPIAPFGVDTCNVTRPTVPKQFCFCLRVRGLVCRMDGMESFLPIIENCANCGACCMEQRSPPRLRHAIEFGRANGGRGSAKGGRGSNPIASARSPRRIAQLDSTDSYRRRKSGPCLYLARPIRCGAATTTTGQCSVGTLKSVPISA